MLPLDDHGCSARVGSSLGPAFGAAQRPVARHRRIKSWLVDRIDGGVFLPDTLIPPERELMKAHGVSRGTLRRAMDELEVEGRIERLPGKGTFVRVPEAVKPPAHSNGCVAAGSVT